jgi:hypothetical protein
MAMPCAGGSKGGAEEGAGGGVGTVWAEAETAQAAANGSQSNEWRMTAS